MDWSQIIPELLKQGALGVTAALAVWFAWQLYKENRTLYRDRIVEGRADLQKMADALNAAKISQDSGTEAMRQLTRVVETAVTAKGGRNAGK